MGFDKALKTFSKEIEDRKDTSSEPSNLLLYLSLPDTSKHTQDVSVM
jgi:hypothetical protein